MDNEAERFMKEILREILPLNFACAYPIDNDRFGKLTARLFLNPEFLAADQAEDLIKDIVLSLAETKGLVLNNEIQFSNNRGKIFFRGDICVFIAGSDKNARREASVLITVNKIRTKK